MISLLVLDDQKRPAGVDSIVSALRSTLSSSDAGFEVQVFEVRYTVPYGALMCGQHSAHREIVNTASLAE